MASLLAAAIFFVGIHFVISGSPLRGKIVASLGDGPFRGLFLLVSVIGIVWLSRAYSQAEYIQLWRKLYGFRPYALVLVLLAFLFVVLAFASPNPTAVGGEALLAKQQPAKGIQRITRHPFLCGVALWALTHLILNGDLASAVFFGSLLIVAFAGPFSIDRKRRKVAGEWRSQGSLYLPRRVRHARATPHALSSPPRKAFLAEKRYMTTRLLNRWPRTDSGLIFSAAVGR